MAPGVTDPDVAGQTLIFDRTPVARIISCAAAFGSGSLLFNYIAENYPEIEALPMTLLMLLVLATIVSALIQYGDHIYVTPDGLLYRNRLLPVLGRNSAAMRWDEIVEIREIRRKILVLFSADGRKVLVDSIAGYAIARREIVRRAGNAALSGTLMQDES
jgi:hypothetical protein